MRFLLVASVAAFLTAPTIAPPPAGPDGLEIVEARGTESDGDWVLVPGQSVVALITHRKGFAGRLAHDHVVAAPDSTIYLAFDPGAPESAAFEVTTRAEDLIVDDAAFKELALPGLRELDILDGFNDISDGDRAEVRKKMLEDGQLNAEEHPDVTARLAWLASVDDTAAVAADRAPFSPPPGFDWLGGVELAAGGGRTEVPILARYELRDDTLRIQAFGESRFTALGIKPYSAFLGAVKNDDLIHLYLQLVAVRGGR